MQILWTGMWHISFICYKQFNIKNDWINIFVKKSPLNRALLKSYNLKSVTNVED